MKRSDNFLFIFLLLLIHGFQVHAQVNDAGLWLGLEAEKKISGKFSVQLSEEFRLNENYSELGTFISEVGVEYRVNKLFSTSLAYRFIQKRRINDSYSTRHRYLLNINIRKKIGQLSVAGRVRYQSQYSDIYSSDDGKVPADYLRTRLLLKYDLNKKYQPYISGETFFHLNRPAGILFDNYRLSAGFEYEFNNKSAVTLGYMIDKEINVSNPWTNYVVVLSWSYKL